MRIDPSTGLTDSETLSYNTVRIRTETYDGQPGMGTGFLYQFRSSKNDNIQALITNRHVLRNVKDLTLLFNPMGKDNKVDLNNDNKIEIQITDLNNHWQGHPNPNIDLAFMSLSLIIDKLYKKEKIPFWFFLRSENFPKSSEWNSLTALEPIVTVGYPNDIWDSINNLRSEEHTSELQSP